MEKYINLAGEKRHFVGGVPEGWRVMTLEEIQIEQDLIQAKGDKAIVLEQVIQGQDEFLQGTYKGAVDHFRNLYANDEADKIMAMLTSPLIPEDLQPITNALLQIYEG